MGQFGMQLPGGRVQRSASPDVYTALVFIAAAALAVACGVMWFAGSKVGVDNQPLTIQEASNIQIPRGQ